MSEITFRDMDIIKEALRKIKDEPFTVSEVAALIPYDMSHSKLGHKLMFWDLCERVGKRGGKVLFIKKVHA